MVKKNPCTMKVDPAFRSLCYHLKANEYPNKSLIEITKEIAHSKRRKNKDVKEFIKWPKLG
jgi:hypothetical protein